MSEKSKSSKSFMFGFLIGGAIGAAIALLYAPKSGKEMREDIKKRAGNLLNEANEYLDLAKNSTLSMMNEGKRKAEEFVSRVKMETEPLLDETNELLKKAKDKNYNSKIDSDQLSGLDAYKDSKKI